MKKKGGIIIIIIGLVIVLLMVLVLPFMVKQVEHYLEYFLFIMGLSATIISGVLSIDLILGVFQNKFLYFITFAVLIAGLIFIVLKDRVEAIIEKIFTKIPLKLFCFLVIVVLGLISSVITAIIAALLLVEIVNAMPIVRKDKIRIVILACFSIGLGAVLTPIGEPLSTIVVSKLHVDFWYLANHLGVYVITGVILVGILGALIIGTKKITITDDTKIIDHHHDEDYFSWIRTYKRKPMAKLLLDPLKFLYLYLRLNSWVLDLSRSLIHTSSILTVEYFIS